MVGDPEQAVLEVEELARHVDGHDLALAVAGDLVAIGEAGEEQDAVIDRLALAHHVGGGLRRALLQGERMDGGAILVVEPDAGFEPSHDALKGWCGCHEWLSARGGRERVESLSHRRPLRGRW
jgi:hypothetical protein